VRETKKGTASGNLFLLLLGPHDESFHKFERQQQSSPPVEVKRYR
jgi:hypothetical protein